MISEGILDLARKARAAASGSEIVEFPDRMGNEETFELGGGSSVTIKAYDGEPLTVERAVYMLEFVKTLVLKTMDV